MRTRPSPASARHDQGFTLIELLVVIVIVGILASIAIPAFLNQRQKGVDGTLRSDLKSLASVVETYSTDRPLDTYFGLVNPPTDASVSAALGSTSANNFRRSADNTLRIKGSPAAGYCIQGQNPAASTGTTTFFWYDSLNGGLRTGPPVASVTAGACGVAGTWYTIS